MPKLPFWIFCAFSAIASVSGFSEIIQNPCQQWCYKVAYSGDVTMTCCNIREQAGKCPAEHCQFGDYQNLDLSFVACSSDCDCPWGFKCCFDYCRNCKICRPVRISDPVPATTAPRTTISGKQSMTTQGPTQQSTITAGEEVPTSTAEEDPSSTQEVLTDASTASSEAPSTSPTPTIQSTTEGSGDDPEGSGDDPEGSGDDPDGSGDDPEGSGDDPPISTSSTQKVSTDASTASSEAPSTSPTSTIQSTIEGSGDDPDGSGDDPEGSGYNPEGSGDDPEGSGDDDDGTTRTTRTTPKFHFPTAAYRNKNVMANNVDIYFEDARGDILGGAVLL